MSVPKKEKKPPIQPQDQSRVGEEKAGRRFTLQALFNDNRFVAILSLVLALIMWFVIYLQNTPNSNETISNVPVSISYENSMAQDLGLEIIGDATATVDVNVTGSRYTVQNLTADDFTARVSLSSVTRAGTYTLSIQVIRNVVSDEYTITSWTPEEIQLTFDQIVTRTFPVEVSTPNLTAADGYLMETPYADIDYVTVTGPQTEVDQISRCAVTIDAERELTETLTTSGTIQFYDAAGSVIESENLEYDHDTVTVTIPIYKTRTLDLQVEFVNVPRGFPIEQLGYTLSRDTILVASPSETIDNIDAITVGPIDFREIDIGTEITLDITLNAGLKNVENVDSVTVTFPSYGLTSRTMDVSKDNFVIENLPSGYTVEVLTEQLEDVRIVGDTSIVNDLTAEDLVGTIDLSQYSISRGRYTVSVKIYVQGRVLAWAVGEYSVEIEATPPETAESASTSG